MFIFIYYLTIFFIILFNDFCYLKYQFKMLLFKIFFMFNIYIYIYIYLCFYGLCYLKYQF